MNEPLILIHGYPFDHSLWDHVIALLQPHARILAPDLPGFGDRPLPTTEPALEACADAILQDMDAADIPRAVITGMSMGGYIALALAERASARVAGIALVSSQAAADSTEAQAIRRTLAQKIQDHDQGAHLAADALLPKLFATADPSPALKRFPIQGAEKAGPAGLAWALEAMARRPDHTKLLQSMQVPVFIVHGEKDQLIPIDKARSLAESSPHFQFRPIPGCGHVSPLEAPAPVAEALKELVEKASRPSEAPAR